MESPKATYKNKSNVFEKLDEFGDMMEFEKSYKGYDGY